MMVQGKFFVANCQAFSRCWAQVQQNPIEPQVRVEYLREDVLVGRYSGELYLLGDTPTARLRKFLRVNIAFISDQVAETRTSLIGCTNGESDVCRTRPTLGG